MKTNIETFYHVKYQYPDAIILFRSGEYYFAMQDDARKINELLNYRLNTYINEYGDVCEQTFFGVTKLDEVIRTLVNANLRVVFGTYVISY